MILCNMSFRAAIAFSTSHVGKIFSPNPCSLKGITRLQMTFDVSGMDGDSKFVDMLTSSPTPAQQEAEQSKSSTKQIIDSILDECLRYSARRPIMIQFDPASRAIWRHWRGTVVAETYKPAAKMALWAVAVYVLFH